MPANIQIALVPSYPVSIQLSGDSGALELSIVESISVELSPILRGLPGSAGSRYTHTQSSASAIWTVAHNLNSKPVVMVADHLDRQIFPDIEWIDNNIVRVTHGYAITGSVFCN